MATPEVENANHDLHLAIRKANRLAAEEASLSEAVIAANKRKEEVSDALAQADDDVMEKLSTLQDVIKIADSDAPEEDSGPIPVPEEEETGGGPAIGSIPEQDAPSPEPTPEPTPAAGIAPVTRTE